MIDAMVMRGIKATARSYRLKLVPARVPAVQVVREVIGSRLYYSYKEFTDKACYNPAL
jgi:hypothetical protein